MTKAMPPRILRRAKEPRPGTLSQRVAVVATVAKIVASIVAPAVAKSVASSVARVPVLALLALAIFAVACMKRLGHLAVFVLQPFLVLVYISPRIH